MLQYYIILWKESYPVLILGYHELINISELYLDNIMMTIKNYVSFFDGFVPSFDNSCFCHINWIIKYRLIL